MGSDQLLEFRGRRIDFERGATPGEFRVLVDGAPIPMTFTETESETADRYRHSKVLQAEAPVAWVRLGRPLPTEFRFYNHVHEGCFRVFFGIRDARAISYNTVIHDSDHVRLAFDVDCASVAVSLDHHTDSTT